MYISYHYPKSRLLGLGYSLGANIMTRYVSEEGVDSRLSSAVVLSCVRTLFIIRHTQFIFFGSPGTWKRTAMGEHFNFTE